jgi:glycosyltransferase involved in cell wall biosynthesis
MSDDLRSVRYSVIVPLWNERENITPLYGHLKETLDSVGHTFECVFVDDGSTDGSLPLLQEIAQVDSRVTVVALRHNAGKSVALGAGFNAARGDYVITMDGDLQHDAADIPRFIQKLEEGFDIVCGWRNQRDGSWMHRVAARCANWVLGKLTGVRIRDWGGGFKAYKRQLVSEVPIYGELQRLIPVLALRRGAKICEVPIVAAPREYGASKYGMASKLPVFFDLLTVRFLLRYLSRPLHFFGMAGVFAIFGGGVLGMWMLLWKLLYGVRLMTDHGPLLIFSAVLIIAGVQLLALGLLAEMQVRHYYQSRGRHTPYDVACVIRAQRNEEEVSD